MVGQGIDGSIASELFTVKALVMTPVDLLNRQGLVIDLAAAQLLFAMPDQAHELVIHARRGDEAAALARRVSAMPAFAGDEVLDWQTLAPEMVSLVRIIDVAGALVLVLVFLAAAAGVANTMLMATFERTREFAMLLALGARPSRIVRMVLAESIVLGLLGAVAGSAVAIALVVATHRTGIDLRRAGWGRADRTVVCGNALVAALLSHADPVRCRPGRCRRVRHLARRLGVAGAAGKPAGTGTRLEGRMIGAAATYAVRSLERNRRRTWVSIVGIGIGCALALTMESLNRGRDELFARMGAYGGAGHLRIVPAGWSQRRDLRLRLADWSADAAAARALPGVAAVTTRSRAQALVAHGHARRPG